MLYTPSETGTVRNANTIFRFGSELSASRTRDKDADQVAICSSASAFLEVELGVGTVLSLLLSLRALSSDGPSLPSAVWAFAMDEFVCWHSASLAVEVDAGGSVELDTAGHGGPGIKIAGRL